jgi:nucleotide-binding universal stress UspA family protein
MQSPAPLIVGIDGSTASIRAALWAADEAAARDAVLDLVYVVDPERTDDLDDAMADAHHAVHRAWQTITDHGKHVKLESEILHGNPVTELANAGRRAALLCLGHKGAKDSAPKPRGSTAAAVLRTAPTSVAIVRRRHSDRSPSFHRWIVAVLDETAESRAVLQTALDEADLRQAPVLALTTWSTTHPHRRVESEGEGDIRAQMDRYLEDSHDDPADVQICAIPMPHDLTTLLEQSAGIEQLIVVGASRHDLVEQLTSPKARKTLRGTNCSILVVHPESSTTLSAFDDEALPAEPVVAAL